MTKKNSKAMDGTPLRRKWKI